MRYRAMVALIAAAMTVTAFAQRGARGGGFSGSRGIGGGHAGFAGHSGFSGSAGGFRPAAPFVYRPGFQRFGSAPGFRPGFQRVSPQASFRRGFPNRSLGFSSHRPAYRPAYAGASRNWYRDRDRNGHRGPRFVGSYGYGYPGWLGYPYLLDPGFLDWSDWDDSTNSQATSAENYQQPGPYPDYGAGDAEPPEPEAYPPYPNDATGKAESTRPSYGERGGATSVPAPEQTLTVIFRNGRAPEKMQNYMLTGKVLTDLDAQHYEEIPLNQIDMAQTQQANHANGLDFQVPVAARD